MMEYVGHMREKHFQRMKETHAQFFTPEQVQLSLSFRIIRFQNRSFMLPRSQLEAFAIWKKEQQRLEEEAQNSATKTDAPDVTSSTATSEDVDVVAAGSDDDDDDEVQTKRQRVEAQ